MYIVSAGRAACSSHSARQAREEAHRVIVKLEVLVAAARRGRRQRQQRR